MPQTTDWITPRQGAVLFMHHRADHFIGQVRARGGRCIGDPASPSDRALAAGVVRPGHGPGEWLWDRAFVEALRDFEGCGSCLAETPDVADTVFYQGLRNVAGLQESLPDEVRALVCRFERGDVLLDACLAHGACAALRIAVEACDAVMPHVDGRVLFVATGLAKVVEAYGRLRRLDAEHPLVRFGLMPRPGAFPQASAPRPGKGGGTLEEVSAAHGFPVPTETCPGAHRHLFAVWEDGVPLAVIHRNGQRRDDALHETLRTPAFGRMDALKAQVRRSRCEVFDVPADAAFAATPVRAPRKGAPA